MFYVACNFDNRCYLNVNSLWYFIIYELCCFLQNKSKKDVLRQSSMYDIDDTVTANRYIKAKQLNFQ